MSDTMTNDAALPPLPDPDIIKGVLEDGSESYGTGYTDALVVAYAQRAVDAALAARAGQERPVAWVLAASLDILADRGEVNCTLWSDANKPEQEWLEPLYADDPRLTWGVPHAGTIRCLRAAEDRIRAGEPPDDVFADYGWTMKAALPALPPEAREAMERALVEFRDIYEWARTERAPLREQELASIQHVADALRAALGDGGANKINPSAGGAQ
jgi:hypothetical protein